ncbi:MAG: zinc-binding dehydrogenase [Candidatus Nanopelagicaceae bacterium]
MKSAAVVNFSSEPHSVEVREVDRPVCGDDDVIIQVEAASVCGSDLHQWEGTNSWPVNYPVVLGHEFGGHVVELGKNVVADGRWHEGDRIVSETAAVVDMSGAMSRQGLYNLDPSRKGFGYGVNGAMTRYAKVASRLLHKIPDNVSFDHASMTEPCAVAYSATIAPGHVRPGDRIVILGPGPIGILSAAMAKLAGADVAIVGLERDKARLEVAKKYGCEVVIGDVKDWAMEVDGLGADGVVDAAGVSATLKIALDVIRPNGWISKVGWGPQPVNFSLDQLVQKNVRLEGSFSHNWPMWERALRMLGTGKLDLTPVLGGTFPIEQWETAFKKMHSGEFIKSVIKPA